MASVFILIFSMVVFFFLYYSFGLNEAPYHISKILAELFLAQIPAFYFYVYFQNEELKEKGLSGLDFLEIIKRGAGYSIIIFLVARLIMTVVSFFPR